MKEGGEGKQSDHIISPLAEDKEEENSFPEKERLKWWQKEGGWNPWEGRASRGGQVSWQLIVVFYAHSCKLQSIHIVRLVPMNSLHWTHWRMVYFKDCIAVHPWNDSFSHKEGQANSPMAHKEFSLSRAWPTTKMSFEGIRVCFSYKLAKLACTEYSLGTIIFWLAIIFSQLREKYLF